MLRTENNRVNGYEGRRSVKNVYAPTVLEEARLTDNRHLAVLWLSDCNRKKEKSQHRTATLKNVEVFNWIAEDCVITEVQVYVSYPEPFVHIKTTLSSEVCAAFML